MNPVVLMSFMFVTRKQVLLVLATLTIILSLPVMAVFALGSNVLSVLSVGISSGGSVYQGPLSTTDLYEWGNCTYWAALLREQAGKPIPNSWGNANTWALYARLGGYVVDSTPSVSAIMQTSAGKLGHVAYVTEVNAATGAWTISEMNVLGLDIVDTKIYPASAAKNFNFIHDKTPGVTP